MNNKSYLPFSLNTAVPTAKITYLLFLIPSFLISKTIPVLRWCKNNFERSNIVGQIIVVFIRLQLKIFWFAQTLPKG